jgi:hypothetical protein
MAHQDKMPRRPQQPTPREESDSDDNQPQEDEPTQVDGGLTNVNRYVRDLVRLSLCHERRRVPLKREEITRNGTHLHIALAYSSPGESSHLQGGAG